MERSKCCDPLPPCQRSTEGLLIAKPFIIYFSFLSSINQILICAKILLDTMALVATAPSTVWRDPNVMSATANTISSISQPLPTLGSAGSPSSSEDLGSTLRQLNHIPGGPGLPNHHHLPPYHQALVQDSGNKSEDDHNDIECVVCGDKSSGKHYGQFTCEGKFSIFY